MVLCQVAQCVDRIRRLGQQEFDDRGFYPVGIARRRACLLYTSRRTFVAVFHAVDLEIHRTPAVGACAAPGAYVGGHVHRRAFVAVSYTHLDVYKRQAEDYYHAEMNYQTIRKAIQTLNPAK